MSLLCFYTFEHRPNETYDICEICFWEDDPIQWDDPNYEGRTNNIALLRARENFLQIGACKEKMTPHVRKQKEDELNGIDSWYILKKKNLPHFKIERWTRIKAHLIIIRLNLFWKNFYTESIAPGCRLSWNKPVSTNSVTNHAPCYYRKKVRFVRQPQNPSYYKNNALLLHWIFFVLL